MVIQMKTQGGQDSLCPARPIHEVYPVLGVML